MFDFITEYLHLPLTYLSRDVWKRTVYKPRGMFCQFVYSDKIYTSVLILFSNKG